MPSLVFELIDDEGYETTASLPAVWEICNSCNGEGKSSSYLGAITADEWNHDWSEDEKENYMQGGMDRQCDCCTGRGSILVVDIANCRTPDQLKVLEAWREQQRELRECDAIHRAEIARGA